MGVELPVVYAIGGKYYLQPLLTAATLTQVYVYAAGGLKLAPHVYGGASRTARSIAITGAIQIRDRIVIPLDFSNFGFGNLYAIVFQGCSKRLI